MALPDIEAANAAACGFDRDEMRNGESLKQVPSSFKAPNIVAFLCTHKGPAEWESKLDNIISLKRVESHLKELKAQDSEIVTVGSPEPYRLTVFNGADIALGQTDDVPEEHKLLVCAASPDGSSCRMTVVKVGDLVLPNAPAPWREIGTVACDVSSSRYVFICCHVKRDERCGYCGTVLYKELSKELSKHKSDDSTVASNSNAHVFPCSHVGGHAMAGNVLVASKEGGVVFGCVRAEDCAEIARALLQAPDGQLLSYLSQIESLKSKVRGPLVGGIRV